MFERFGSCGWAWDSDMMNLAVVPLKDPLQWYSSGLGSDQILCV